MPRTRARHAPGQNLAAVLDKRRKHLRLFVIDQVNLIDAEAANLLLAHEIALAALRATRRPRSALGPGPPGTPAETAGVTRGPVGALRGVGLVCSPDGAGGCCGDSFSAIFFSLA